MKYVLLCDYGLDDAVATVYVLDHRNGAHIDILPIGGNSEKNVAHRNALTLLARYAKSGGDLSGVRVIDTRDVEQVYAALPSIHGADGMGDVFAPESIELPTLSYDKWLDEKEDIYLCSFGPCTLVPEIIAAKRVTNLLIMAGNVSETPNHLGYEFNHVLDKPAFERSVKFEHVIGTLDSCRHRDFNAVINRPKGSDLFNTIVSAALKYATARHADNCYIYDYITARYLFEPQLFDIVPATDKDGNNLKMLKRK